MFKLYLEMIKLYIARIHLQKHFSSKDFSIWKMTKMFIVTAIVIVIFHLANRSIPLAMDNIKLSAMNADAERRLLIQRRTIDSLVEKIRILECRVTVENTTPLMPHLSKRICGPLGNHWDD